MKYPPLGIAYIAAVLEKTGCEVEVLDLSALNARFTRGDVVREVMKIQPDFVAMYFNIAFAYSNYQLVHKLREAGFDKPVIGGGHHATIRPDELMDHGVDFVCRGDAEETMVQLVEHLNGRGDLQSIEGLSYRDGQGEHTHNPIGNIRHPRPDELPFPAVHLFRPHEYYPEHNNRFPIACMSFSRGCPYTCSYCFESKYHGAYSVRSVDSVIEEMTMLRDRYDTKFVIFVDDAFSIDRKRVVELCERMLDIKLGLKWSCTTRFDTMTPETLELMKKAGCEWVIYGIESLDKETLQQVKRRSHLDTLVAVLENTRKAGIKIEVNFMFGWPWDNKTSLQTTLESIKLYSRYVDRIGHHGNVIPLPGTTFYDDYKDQYDYEDWWLQRDFGLKYGMLQTQPFFRTFHFEDYGFFNFFNHSRASRRQMRKIINHIGSFNTRQRTSTWRSRYFFIALTKLSYLTFPISPALERVVTRGPMRLFERYQQWKLGLRLKHVDSSQERFSPEARSGVKL